MTGYWDEVRDGVPCREIDRATWTDRHTRAGNPPPQGMGPVGRRPAEQAADRLRYAALLIALALVAAGACIWSLGALR
ncbi:hypothetical protein MXD62_16795 [Frankia sp. Mgl5]|uniref:hypothetical protein n=1 Tax=Frankia sp. Mgl5 TaxID=2933793 RepID=UPI00200F027F|nr:hypothetical protein [Frankia sp. Mgl5]MCK9928815.1 hypothetical protein [Frankia sp. Mgl5]